MPLFLCALLLTAAYAAPPASAAPASAAAAVKHMPGVVSRRLQPLDGRLIVRYDPRETDAATVTRGVADAIDRVEQ